MRLNRDTLSVTVPGPVTPAVSRGNCDLAPYLDDRRVTTVSDQAPAIRAQSQVVLSLFPGIDLFGRAFEAEGFCVVRGPDLIYGGDIRRFHVPRGRFDGIIGGPPCVDFSSLRRAASRDSTAEGCELIGEFLRVVIESGATWFLMENVARVPDVRLDDYTIQRIDIRGGEVGLKQRRLRHFQFGSVTGRLLSVDRRVTVSETSGAITASEGRRSGRRGWPEFCGLMGLAPLDLPGMTQEARYRAVGNAVPLPMGRLLAVSLRSWLSAAKSQRPTRLCVCGCGRSVTGRRVSASPACRKRLERQRRGNPSRFETVTGPPLASTAVSRSIGDRPCRLVNVPAKSG
jgi:DNA (cytosine-5)-methyltransferase 1